MSIITNIRRSRSFLRDYMEEVKEERNAVYPLTGVVATCMHCHTIEEKCFRNCSQDHADFLLSLHLRENLGWRMLVGYEEWVCPKCAPLYDHTLPPNPNGDTTQLPRTKYSF